MTALPPAFPLSRWAALEQLRAALAEGVPCLEASGLWGVVARAGRPRRWCAPAGRPALVVTAAAADRHRAALDLGFFLASLPPESGSEPAAPGRPVLEFPAAEPATWRGGRHREHAAEQALCCHRLLRGDAVPIVTTPSALSAPGADARGFPRAHRAARRRRQRRRERSCWGFSIARATSGSTPSSRSGSGASGAASSTSSRPRRSSRSGRSSRETRSSRSACSIRRPSARWRRSRRSTCSHCSPRMGTPPG